jgi:hypothetical protein
MERRVVSFTSGHFIPRERAPDILSIGGAVGPKTCVDDVEKRINKPNI